MKHSLNAIWNTVVKQVYPRFCAICRRDTETGWLCAECQRGVEPVKAPYCERCSRPYEGLFPGVFLCPNCEDRDLAFSSAVSKYLARGTVREIVHRLKYNGQFHLRQTLAEWLIDGFSDPRITCEPYDAIVPVPLHPARIRERGYDQVQATAELAARRLRVPLWRSLRRKRYTRTQTRLDRKQRMQNLRSAFEIRKEGWVEGKRIILVDDILTTGATLDECARVLRKAGAISVRAVTVARG